MKDTDAAIIRFEAAVKKATVRILHWPEKTIRLFHHNDADGLASGAILSKAFNRAGFSIDRCCLEKPYPEILEKILSGSDQLILFADFAGRIAPLIAELNAGKNLVVIVDHHPATPSSDPAVINLDTELYGLKGDRDISASTACFLVAKALSPSNVDLAWLALVGAIGDGFGINGRLSGENRRVAEAARKQGMADRYTYSEKEEWVLNTYAPRPSIPIDDLVTILDALGGAGYYSHGPEAGVRLLLDGWSETAAKRAGELAILVGQLFSDEIRRIEKQGMNQTPRIQWVNVENRFSPMGVKMIGLFCQQLKTRPFIDPDRYILGAMDLPADVPGFGPMGGRLSKLSMRLPPVLEEAVRNGQAPGADTFFPEATTALGGFSDACHSLAAATVLNRGRVEALVEKMEHLLSDPD